MFVTKYGCDHVELRASRARQAVCITSHKGPSSWASIKGVTFSSSMRSLLKSSARLLRAHSASRMFTCGAKAHVVKASLVHQSTSCPSTQQQTHAALWLRICDRHLSAAKLHDNVKRASGLWFQNHLAPEVCLTGRERMLTVLQDQT